MRWKWQKAILLTAMVILLAFQVAARRQKVEAPAISPLSIEMNIPAFRLDLFYNSHLMRSYLIGVGMPYYPSPRRNYFVDRVEWNPWWFGPSSSWAQGGAARPGPKNPLGPVKMKLRGKGLFLIHGTNKPESVGKTMSHGCIRMFSDEAIKLSWTIMVLAGTQEPLRTPSYYKALDKPHLVKLRQWVPVKLVYRRVEIRNKLLLIHPNPYNKNDVNLSTVKKVLYDNGYRESSVPMKKIGAILNKPLRDTYVVPLKDQRLEVHSFRDDGDVVLE